MDSHEMPERSADPVAHQRRLKWGLGVFLAVAAYFLLTEHRAHVFAALPWLLLLACPLMHLFMHRGHRSHSHDQSRVSGEKQDQTQAQHQHAGHGCC